MGKKKSIKSRGKLQLSKFFKEFNKGDSVAIVEEQAVRSSFPRRMQGRTGIVEGKRGRAYVVNIKDSNMNKKFIVEPIHLKKIKIIEA